ncbi:MAG: hypothetical protein M9925_15510 [Chloroflexi bacterium]|nr:hypothetical protein [Chloroflexota bacterium]
MLRRKPDNTVEFRDIERALYGAAPHSLSPERREALRARIFSELGAQDVPRRSFGNIASERWIAVPVGASVAAAVIAATNYVLDPQDSRTGTTWVATASGSITVDGVEGPTAEPGQRIEATGPSWVAVGKDVRVGLEAGSALRFASSSDRLALLLDGGTHHILSQQSLLEVRGQRWVAHMTGPGALEVSIHQWHTSLVAFEGETVVQYAGNTYLLRPGDRPLLLLSQPPDDPGAGLPEGDPGTGPANGGGNPNPGSVGGPERDDAAPPDDYPSAPSEASTGPGVPGPGSQHDAAPNTSGQGGNASTPAETGTPQRPPEGVPPSAQPPADPPPLDPPPVDSPPAHPPGADPPGGPPEAPPPASPPQAPGNGNGNGSPPSSPGAGNGNNGNGLGNTGEHPHGGPPGLEPEANIAGGGNAGANAPPNSNAGGNSGLNAAPNSNARGNSGANAAPNSNARGNSGANVAPNSNAGGNSGANAAPDSNAGGNSGANAAPNSKAGGNSEANAAPNSNAGGNGRQK